MAADLEPQLSRRTIPTQIGPSDVAAHRGQTAMARVPYDFLVGHAIAIGSCHKAGAQAVRADRLRQAAFQSDICGAANTAN
jgi:hypothetical protein